VKVKTKQMGPFDFNVERKYLVDLVKTLSVW